MDDGPPEFVPGKKWEWRDPSKMAEDPNATPGTCKPNPLLSSAALQQFSVMAMGNNKNNIIRSNFASHSQQTICSDNETKVFKCFNIKKFFLIKLKYFDLILFGIENRS